MLEPENVKVIRLLLTVYCHLDIPAPSSLPRKSLIFESLLYARQDVIA